MADQAGMLLSEQFCYVKVGGKWFCHQSSVNIESRSFAHNPTYVTHLQISLRQKAAQTLHGSQVVTLPN